MIIKLKHYQVYSPEPDFLENAIRKMPTLHDKEYAKKLDPFSVGKGPLVMPYVILIHFAFKYTKL